MDHCARWLVTRGSLPLSWAWVLPLLCGADAAIAAARFPDFSWDKLPLYVHVRKAKAFSARELEHLATFPLITLEKTTGLQASGSTDAGTLVAATAIKRLNPRAKVLFYRNVLVHYPGYSFDRQLDQIGQPFLKDSRNRSQLVRGKVEAYDLTVPAVVDWWVETASEVCRHEAIDGLFLDGNVKVLSPYLENRLPAGRKDALIAGYHSMMQRVRAALPENDLMIANLLRARFADGGLGELALFDGSYLEAFDVPVGDVSRAEYVAKGVETVQRAARAGKIIALTLGLGESGADADRIDDARARLRDLAGLESRVDYLIGLFLVAAERHSYLCLHDGYAVDGRAGESLSKVWLHRFPQYDRPLGPPKGPARRTGLVFTREFEHLSVKVDLERERAELRWHDHADAPPVDGVGEWDVLRQDVLAMKNLTAAPVMHEVDANSEASGMRRIFFDGLPFRGRPTRVFAWLGMPDPDRSRAAKVPGVVLVHGGGGTAFKEWVQKWNEKGFAAISIAVEGQTDDRTPGRPGAERGGWQSHPWAGPARVGIYGDSEKPLPEQWMYHAVADTVLANSLLRSLPGVDARRVGLMGVSWGGIITSTVAGIDDRFAFAIPVYGCGHLADAPNQYGRSLADNDLYRQVWDPMQRLGRARMPMLWLSWPGDLHFPLDCQAASYRQASGPRVVALIPSMRHGHGPAWNRPESYAFAESVTSGGAPWCRQSAATGGSLCRVVMNPAGGRSLDRAELWSTTGTGATGTRTWTSTPAVLRRQDGRWIATATPPHGTTAWFMNFHSQDLVVSSEYQQVQEAPQGTPSGAAKEMNAGASARGGRKQDGRITKALFLESQMALFNRLDADASGGLDAGEFTNTAVRKVGDTDGDGILSRAEYRAVFERQFARLDKNGDGVLTDAERRR